MAHMDWLGFGRIVVTEDSIYKPSSSPMFEAVVLLLVAAGVVFDWMIGRRDSIASVLFLTILTVPAVRTLIAYRKYGRLGKPLLALREGVLSFAPEYQNLARPVALTLAEFQELDIYGRLPGRIYRFVRSDGTYVEVIPWWGQRVGRSAIEFVQRTLAPLIRVTVEEPQTTFASVRGDGPAPADSA